MGRLKLRRLELGLGLRLGLGTNTAGRTTSSSAGAGTPSCCWSSGWEAHTRPGRHNGDGRLGRGGGLGLNVRRQVLDRHHVEGLRLGLGLELFDEMRRRRWGQRTMRWDDLWRRRMLRRRCSGLALGVGLAVGFRTVGQRLRTAAGGILLRTFLIENKRRFFTITDRRRTLQGVITWAALFVLGIVVVVVIVVTGVGVLVLNSGFLHSLFQVLPKRKCIFTWARWHGHAFLSRIAVKISRSFDG